MTSIKYDNEHICPKCGGHNDYKVVESINLHPCEIETKCTDCGWEDYWAYGWYESKEDEAKTNLERGKQEMSKLDEINNKWVYTADNSDKWSVLDINDEKLKGDCEDYSLTVLYHDICKGNLKDFIKYIVTGKATFWYVKAVTSYEPNAPRAGHVVMEVEGKGFIDNWSKKFTTKDYYINKYKHDFVKKYSKTSVLHRILNNKIGSIPTTVLAFGVVYGVLTLLVEILSYFGIVTKGW